MLNKATLIGNLGRDPEINTKGATTICNCSLATNEKYTDKSGQKQERTEWHRLVLFGKQAETLSKYAKAGQMLYVEGRIQTREYDGKDGTRKKSTEIVVSEFKFLGGGGKGTSRGGAAAQDPFEQAKELVESAQDTDYDDEKLPF